jgi:hypothetical protein
MPAATGVDFVVTPSGMVRDVRKPAALQPSPNIDFIVSPDGIVKPTLWQTQSQEPKAVLPFVQTHRQPRQIHDPAIETRGIVITTAIAIVVVLAAIIC